MRYLILISSLCLIIPFLGLGEEPSSSPPSGDSTERLEKVTPVAKPWTEPEKPQIPPKIKEALARKIPDIILGNVEIRSLLSTLAIYAKLNIIATKDVSGRMTVFLKKLEDISVGDILEIILVTQHLAMEIKGEIINIMTAGEFQTLYGRPYVDTRELKIVEFNYLTTKMIEKILDTLKGDNHARIIDEAAKQVILIDYPDRLRRMEMIIKRSDTPLVTKTFELKNATVATIDALLKATNALTPEVGKTQVDTRTKQIIITDTVEKLKEITHLIAQLDVKSRQVIIEARMVQITLKEEFYMGVDWHKIFSSQSQWGGLEGTAKYPFPSDAIKVKPTDTFVGTYKPSPNFEGTIKLLQQYGNLRAISSPRLVARDNTPAKFLVGQQDAYVETTVSTSEGGTTTSTNVKFIDVGISLAVSPTINADSYVTMHLEPEISSVYDRVKTSTGDPVPLLQKTTASVDVMVKDGVTIVIAGLIRDEKRSATSGIPVLSVIPVLGGLFRQTGDVTEKTETVIFLTPYIISGDADASVISKMEDMTGKQPKDIREIK